MRIAVVPLIAILISGASALGAESGVVVGAGMIYNPIAKLRFAERPEYNYDIVDNFIWEPRVYYDFGNGIAAGALFDIYHKRIRPGGIQVSNLSLWGAGLWGSYGYAFTESGHSLLIGGMEFDYDNLADRSNSHLQQIGSFGIAAFVGMRFLVGRNISLEFNYRMGWLEFDFGNNPEKEYRYSGSSLGLSVGYKIPLTKARKED